MRADWDVGLALLASNFSILLGSIEITVPEDLEPGWDYDIVCEYCVHRVSGSTVVDVLLTTEHG